MSEYQPELAYILSNGPPEEMLGAAISGAVSRTITKATTLFKAKGERYWMALLFAFLLTGASALGLGSANSASQILVPQKQTLIQASSKWLGAALFGDPQQPHDFPSIFKFATGTLFTVMYAVSSYTQLLLKPTYDEVCVITQPFSNFKSFAPI